MRKIILIIALLLLTGCNTQETVSDHIPTYDGEPYIIINDNIPYFTASEIDKAAETVYEEYGKLDDLDRCTYAIASIDQSLMPIDERDDISFIKPTGWHNDRYDFIDGGNLYNRCHLIGRMLTGEDANAQNLITGTRYMNTSGMLPFEEKTARHIEMTDHHVLYRVTPIFVNDELLCRGVLMECQCTEDDLVFNVFVYNVEPGIIIDYKTGDNKEDTSSIEGELSDFVINTNTKKFHLPDCTNIESINKDHRKTIKSTEEDLITKGYTPAKCCLD